MSDRVTVVLYEDKYHGELHRLLKRVRTQDLARGAAIIEPATARGDGGFVGELPTLLRTIQRQTKRPPDRVVCVADADRPANLVLGARPLPDGATLEEVREWLERLEDAWRTSLLERARVSGDDSRRVRVVCLRWSKESLLIACPDALKDFAGEARVAVTVSLDACDPPLTAVSDAHYLLTYRRPARCIGDIVWLAMHRKYKKGRDDDDLIRDHIIDNRERRVQLVARSPDLARLIELIDAPD